MDPRIHQKPPYSSPLAHSPDSLHDGTSPVSMLGHDDGHGQTILKLAQQGQTNTSRLLNIDRIPFPVLLLKGTVRTG